ncbi:MAG: serine hydrolase domain-containing protein [Bacteroidota bacterium]
MKTLKYVRAVIGLITFSSLGCSSLEMELPLETCVNTEVINQNHPKSESLQQKIDQMVDLGVPGVVFAIKDSNGIWAGTSGLAKIETETALEICHLQFGQSVAKTYMATAILMLYEDGRIELEEPISSYLSESIISDISNAKEVTVRMLLNHTSGIAEYNDKPSYVSYLLQNPLHEFSVHDYLNYIRGSKPKFLPGERYSYTNTNYVLLALIADSVTGNHKRFIQEEILITHDLNDSYYHTEGFMESTRLVNTYWDRYSNGIIENCSDMHRTNVGSLIGDDGIIATPLDYISFLEKLLTNQILSETTMDQMLDFVETNEDGPIGYGLGVHQEFYKGREDLGHTGGGIGAGCILGHFTQNDTYYFIGINLGVSITPKVSDDFERIMDEINDSLIE